MEVAAKSGNAPDVLLKQQPFAEPGKTIILTHIIFTSFLSIPAKVHEVVTNTNRLLRNKVPAILKSMRLYLANEETEHILFRPIKVESQHMLFRL